MSNAIIMRIDAMTDEDIQTFLRRNIDSVRERMASACQRAGRDPNTVTLVAVTKYVSNRIAQLVVDSGLLDLGESRPQELWRKAESAHGSVRWHLIGHLQRNKINRTVPLVQLLHSADSLRLLTALNNWGQNENQQVNTLLEVNLTGESAKTGMVVDNVALLCADLLKLNHVAIRGLMTMAALQDAEACRPTFRQLRELRDRLRPLLGDQLEELSMGMSNDFEVAIEEGATLVRIGSSLFEGIPESVLKS